MSGTGASDLNKTHKKPSHRRNDSGELDVFEAARYFSAAAEVSGGHNGFTFAQKLQREERQQGWRSGGGISLDFPVRNSIPSQTQVMEKQVLKEKKKYKQPSSPGGRLASFLNSLFHQIPNKKKKSKSTTTTQSVKDDDESPGGGGRRKRRSSISHFHSGSNNTTEYSKSIYSSSMSSGFRTPPTKFYKDLRSYSDHKPVLPSLAKYDEKFKVTSGCGERFIKNSGAGFLEKERSWADRFPSEEREFGKFSEVGDDGDSDSSSDLFELENCDLGYHSSGLPVYETTHIDSIKRGVPISNGA